MNNNRPIALIIGLCSHGLAMSRALHKQGVEVHAFEAKTSIPGIKTNSATVHSVASIKNKGLVYDLVNFKQSKFPQREVVLFATNDNNVKVIGNALDVLEKYYLISWRSCNEQVLSLLLKNNIEARCEQTQLLYPKSFVLDCIEKLSVAGEHFDFPIIAKPVKPQSGFKAKKCQNLAELTALTHDYKVDLPFLLQDWIEGTDEDLYFGAMYLDKGQVCSEFVGQKLASYPPAMGQTTVAISVENEEVISLTKTFFQGLEMSGPVSLEFKKDQKGRYWVIEPTIGRTDFWVGLCIDAGYNILFEEYQHAIGSPIDAFAKEHSKPTIWFDSERDITAFPRFIKYVLPGSKVAYKTSFSFLTLHDFSPFLYALKNTVKKRISRVVGQLKAKKSVEDDYDVQVFGNYQALPEKFKQLLAFEENHNIFAGQTWFENYCATVTEHHNATRFFCLTNLDGDAVALLPMQQQTTQIYGLKINCLRSLSNYYSPYFNIITAQKFISEPVAYQAFIRFFKENSNAWHLIELFPLEQQQSDIVSNVCVFPIVKNRTTHTINWFNYAANQYEDYIGRLSSRLKNTIKRKSKKLDKTMNWKITIYRDEQEVETALTQYEEVYSNSWKPTEPFSEFIAGLVKLSVKRNWLRLGVLSIDDQPVATQLWLIANNTAYIYKLAYRQEFSQYSPGTILTERMLKHAFSEDKVKKIDFLTGNDEFKKDWMEQSRSLYKFQIFNLLSIKSAIIYLKEKISHFNQ